MKKIWLVIGGMCTVVAAAIIFFVWQNFHENLRVAFLDVGQGDAIFIRTPMDEKILIDGGPAGGVLLPLGEELRPLERYIDLVVITHPDLDHVAGIGDVLQRYEVGRILLTGVRHDSAEYSAILKIIAEKNIPTVVANEETDFEFGDVKIDTIWPRESVVGVKPADANSLSIVMKIYFGESSVLLTGDLPVEAEEELLEMSVDLSADILKLGHHGSKNSSSEEFLATVGAEMCVVSAGDDNNFGHPHTEVLERAEAAGCEIVATTEEGTIVFESEGEGWYKI